MLDFFKFCFVIKNTVLCFVFRANYNTFYLLCNMSHNLTKGVRPYIINPLVAGTATVNFADGNYI